MKQRGFGAALLLLWAATAAMMWRSHVSDPFDPRLVGTARYGHNHAGALGQGLLAISIELGVALLLLRPWAARAGVGRAGLGLLLALPWAMLSMMTSMHAGSIVALHFLWTAVLAIWFFALLVAEVRRAAA